MKSLLMYIAASAIGILIYSALEQSHTESKCFKQEEDCRYVQIETEHGAQRMVYICE